MAFAGFRRIAATVAMLLTGGLVEGLSLAMLVPLLGMLTGDGGGALRLAADRAFALTAASPFQKLVMLTALFVVAMTLRAVVIMVRDRMLTTLQARYVEHQRLRLLMAVADAPWSRIAGLRHARVTNALTSEVGRVAVAAHVLPQIAVALIMISVQVGLTLFVSWRMGLLALAALTGGAVVAIRRLRVAERHGMTLGHAGLKLANTAAQLLGGLKQAAAENRQRDFVGDFATTGEGLIASQLAYQRRVARFQCGTSVTLAFASAATLIAGAWFEADRAALLTTLVILFRMAGPAVGLQRDMEALATALPAFDNLSVLRAELRDHAAPPPAVGRAFDGPIALDRVTYRHAGGAGVRDVDLAIAPGEMLGLMGPSGAGKTTLIDLIAGLLPPQTGEVLVGGKPLTPGDRAAWRERIAYVGQDAFLINDTVRRNLLPRDGDEAAAWSALGVAAMDGIVRAMPHGLDTELAERGGRLSGGERQRVAIARAVLRRPALLILDEATNAIDVETEARVLSALSALDPTMAVVIVAHRTETLRHCSRVVRVEDGRVAEAPMAHREASA